MHTRLGSVVIGTVAGTGGLINVVALILNVAFPKGSEAIVLVARWSLALAFVLLAVVASQLGAAGLTAGPTSPKRQRDRVLLRWCILWRRFPISGWLIVGTAVHFLVWVILDGLGPDREGRVFAFNAFFFAFVSLVNLRVFLGAEDLLRRWDDPDKGSKAS